MDNLTHTLTGLMLSRAGLGKFHPRGSLILMLAANMPDVDVVTLVAGAATYFHHHRGITHALISIPVVALLPVLVAWLFRGKHPPKLLAGWLISVVGVASHLLLDWTNPYGIRLFLPFDDSWPMLSITSVVDVWIWLILLIAALAPMLGRLVSSEIGARPETGRGLAITALVLFAAYDTGRWFLHERAVTVLDSQMYNGESPVRVFAYPDKLNPMVWDGVIETGATYIFRKVSLSGEGGQAQGRIAFKPEASPAIQAAAQDPLFQRLRGFSKVMLWSTTPANEPEGATRVSAMDLYFGFSVEALVDAQNRVIDSTFRF